MVERNSLRGRIRLSRELEIEFKNIVCRNAFLDLLERFRIQKGEFHEQTNHYFDTDSFDIKNSGAALRIRTREGHYELTLKKAVPDGLLEITQLLHDREAKEMLGKGIVPDGEVREELSAMGIPLEEVSLFGSLTTNRAEIAYKGGLLVFDHSHYLGGEDYEIEYEVKDREGGEKIFKELLEELNIPVQTADSKIRRFYKAKKRQNGVQE